MRPLVIAYGNSLRGDDGVSFAVLDRTSQRVETSFMSMREPQLDLEFSEAISESSLVVFIDASVVGEPGDVAMQWIEPRVDEIARSHDCTPGALLAYTKAVHGRAPRAALVTVVGSSFDFCETLSVAAQSGVSGAARIVAELVEEWQEEFAG